MTMFLLSLVVVFYIVGVVLYYGWEVAFVTKHFSVYRDTINMQDVRSNATLGALFSWAGILLGVVATTVLRMLSKKKDIKYQWAYGWSK